MFRLSANLVCMWIMMTTLGTISGRTDSAFGGPCEEQLDRGGLAQEILKGDWAKVRQIVEDATACSTSLPAFVLRSHAHLATGRNNEAAASFYLVQGLADLAAWDDWTESLVARHPDAAVSHYLRGDARARLGDLDGAIASFDKALQRDPAHHLALNARGVVHGILYQAGGDPTQNREHLVSATADLDEVNRLQPGFADGFVNRGLLDIEARLLPGAKIYFDRAVQTDPSCGLAYLGRSLVALEEVRVEDAHKDLVQANSLLPRFPFILHNARALAAHGDTSASISVLAAIPGEADTARGIDMQSAMQLSDNLLQFGHDLLDVATLGLFEPLGDLYQSTGRLFRDGISAMMFGGVYLDVKVRTGTARVWSNYALAYPRPASP